MRWLSQVGLVLVVGWGLSAAAWAQLSAADIEALRAQGEREGWTFVVTPNEATAYPLEQLCGLVMPDRWQDMAPSDPCTPPRALPAAFDWRSYTPMPPVRNQGGCGSCWAFATVGPLECNIKIKDGVDVNLSEQWLVSCNRDGWSCSGGWWAHDYHASKTDSCGGSGAVLEQYFPYTATNAACNCPYPHAYHIDRWANITGGVDGMKQAIMAHGPITVGVYVNSAFQAYGGGIFNGCASGTVNHGVTLVGWDDNQGTGVWIMRNSWGPNWGESGYMRIPYGCSQIGFAACYVVYAGKGLSVTPADAITVEGDFGGPFAPSPVSLTLKNTSDASLNYEVAKTQPWVTLSSTGGTLAAGATATVSVSVNEEANALDYDTYTDTITLTNTTDHRGDTSRALNLVVGGVHKIYGWNMDTDPGWAPHGLWAWGTPTGGSGDQGGPDPTSGYTGTKVYGYNLDGGYANDMTQQHLYTGAINCANLSRVSLRFWRWLGVQGSAGDHASVWVSNNGSIWICVWQNGTATIDDQGWVYQKIDLSQYADGQSQVYLRWTMGATDGAGTYCGWNIDDVEIWAEAPIVPFVTGDMNCDGVVNNQDIDPFVVALFNANNYATGYPGCDILRGDFNGDGAVNNADIDGFIDCLLNRSCP